MGEVTGGWMLAKGAEAACAMAGDDSFYAGKIALARVYADQVLTRAGALADAATSGGEDLHGMTVEALGA
jgi:hypothetical protein